MMFSGWSTRQVLAALMARALRRVTARVMAVAGNWSPTSLPPPVRGIVEAGRADTAGRSAADRTRPG
jgi:hypothetical protein